MSGQPLQPITSSPSPMPRKRTMSFSSPQPTKSPRTLQRTNSHLSLSDMEYQKAGTSISHINDLSVYTRPPRPTKERRRSLSRTRSDRQITFHVEPSRPAPSPAPTKKAAYPGLRTTSPLAPTRSILPPRAAFPRSKPEPDLYRVAIITRMRMSPEGEKVLHLGPRLAFSIYSATHATRELERIVASQRDNEGDVFMGDSESVFSSSWVILPQDDWEMVEE